MTTMANQEAPEMLDKSTIPNAAGETGLFISARITIHAPAEKVFKALTDLSTYPAWNSFVPSAEVTPGKDSKDTDLPSTEGRPQISKLKVGDGVKLHVRMKPTDTSLKDSQLRVTEVTESDGKVFRLSWGGNAFAHFLLHAHRIMEVSALPDAEDDTPACEFRTWEVMDGLLLGVLKAMYGKTLQDRFFDWARDLKEFAERDGKSKADEAAHPA